MRGIGISQWLRKAVLAGVAVGLMAAASAGRGRPCAVCAAQRRSASASDANTRSEPQLIDFTDRQGPFRIGDEQYTVTFREKTLPADAVTTEAGSATLVGLEILGVRDIGQPVMYQETFPYAFENGRFSQSLTASASVLSGNLGAALVIRFLERAAGTETQHVPAKESWQVFGMVKGHLAPFGAVLPLGQGADTSAGGVMAGSMTQGGIAVTPLASTAELLEFRAWTGNFYVLIPVRMDWEHGKWAEGEECYELANGTLRERGCSLRVDARREQRPRNAADAFVRLHATLDDDPYNSEDVLVRPESQVDFGQVLAIVHWETAGRRVRCGFDNVWLRVRINDREGWVRSEAFEALGLPRSSPK